MKEFSMKARIYYVFLALIVVVLGIVAFSRGISKEPPAPKNAFDQLINANAAQMIQQGRQIFRFDTFGDEQFWGDTLMLHRAIEGKRFGGIGEGVNPRDALALGLKVDVDALPVDVIQKLKKGPVSLDDPATTLSLAQAECHCGSDRHFQSARSAEIQGGAQIAGYPMRAVPFHGR
jgi:hypothetical protein